MPVVAESVHIASEPEVVFAYLSDASNVAQWDRSIVAAEQLDSGPISAGTRWRGTSKILGRTFRWVTEVTEIHAPERMSSRSVEGDLTFTASYRLRPIAGATLLTYRLEAESGLGGLFGRLGDPLVQNAQSRAVRGSLARLAQLLSAQPVR